MKKEQLIIPISFILVSLMILPFISAIDIKLSKEVYHPGETLQAEIFGNFISLKPENILIYKQEIVHSNPVISDLTKQNEIYYFYAILPEKEGNFSLRIENSQYIEEGEIKTDILIKNFTIEKTNKSALSINPGFVLATKDFSIKIKSLKKNLDVNAEFEANHEIKNFSLIEGLEKTMEFSISNLTPQKSNIKINDYNIPVFILSKTISNFLQEKELEFYPSELKATLFPKKYFYEIRLINIGERNLTNIELSNNLNLDLPASLIKSLKKGQFAIINFTADLSAEKILSGEIIAKFEGKNVTFPVSFKLAENEKDVIISETSSSLDCSEVGKICFSGEECNGVIRDSKQGQCCLGDCIKPSSNNYLIAIVLLIIAIGILGFFIFKIKNRIKPKSTDEILKERASKFRERMAGKEVNRSLDKI